MIQKMMLRILSIGLLVAMLIPLSSAQVESSGCYPDFRSRIGATATYINFDAMCDVYVECLSGNSIDCILPAFEVAFVPCEGIDACENEAILYAATIDLFNHPYLNYGISFDLLPIDEVIEGLTFIRDRDYEKARRSYTSITADYGHPMITLSMGHSYSLMGDAEKAIRQYTGAAESLNEPITYWARAREYARLDVNLARLDLNSWFDLVSQADVPELQAIFAPIVDELSLDSIYQKEEWLWYSTEIYVDGYDGLEVTDLSAELPTEIVLYHVDDESIVLENVPFTFGNFLSPTIVKLELNKKGEYRLWGIFFQQSAEDPITLTLEYDDLNNHYMGYLQVIYFTELRETHFILAPADQPDPR